MQVSIPFHSLFEKEHRKSNQRIEVSIPILSVYGKKKESGVYKYQFSPTPSRTRFCSAQPLFEAICHPAGRLCRQI